MLREATMPHWVSALQLVACAALTATFFLRRHVPAAASILIVTLSLYACGAGAIGIIDPLTAAALGIAMLFATSAFVILVETETMSTQCASTLETTPSTRIIIGECRPVADTSAPPASKQNLETAAYALSHDLRAPLRAIEGFARTVMEDWGERIPASAAHDLQEIRAGVERMQRMISRWLSFLRDDQFIKPEHVDLSALAESVATELRTAEPQRAVAIKIERNLDVVGDPVLLRELLQNLIANAWKFTRQRPAAAIEVGMLRRGDQSVYFVRDNGIGFGEKDSLRLFEPFTKLHAPTDYEGSGIGLTIARNIVAAHGGHIWAEGRHERGAVFSFTLAPTKRELAMSDPGRSLFDFRRTQ